MLDLRDRGNSRYPTAEYVLDAIAGWVKSYRSMPGTRDDLGQCGQEETVKIARDLGLPVSDLRGLTAKGPDAANALSRMLCALSMDPASLAEGDPATMRDLQRTCILCGQKSRCKHDLAKGTVAQHFRQFCPNAYTLDALLKQKSSRAGIDTPKKREADASKQRARRSRINKSLRPARLPHDHRMPLLRVGRRAAICRSAAGLSQHKERAGSPPTMHSKKHEGGKGNSHETPERQK